MNDIVLWVSIGMDLIVICLFAFAIARGYKKGFVKAAYHLISFALAIVLTYLFYPYMVRLLKLTHVSDTISGAFSHLLTIPTEAADNAASAISSLKIPQLLKTFLIENNNYEVYRLLGVETLTDYINAYLTNMVINAMGILITFVIVLLIIKIAAVLLEIVDHLPVIRTLNKLLGVVMGAATGLVYIWVFCLLLTFAGAFAKLPMIYPGIAQSLLTGFFYNHNILLESLLKIFGV